MATYIFSNTTDLDSIFEPRGAFAKRADVGIYSGNTDISNLYAPVSHGSPAANTGIYDGSTDIGQLFAAKGSVSYAIDARDVAARSYYRSSASAMARARVFWGLTGVAYGQTEGTGAQVPSETSATGQFNWIVEGDPTDYEIRLTKTSGDGNLTGTPLGTWIKIASVYSLTISVTASVGIVTANAAGIYELRPVGGGPISTGNWSLNVTAEHF